MAMDAREIESLIKAALPDATVEIKDLAGDGDHYAATVTLAAFKGKSRVQQHQMVYAALQGRMGGALHALALTTVATENCHHERGALTAAAEEQTMTDAHQVIDNEVKSNDVVLFMKGTPQFPMCGFSGQVVQILDYLGVPYKGVNVLEDDVVRQGIKDYSNWPTIPQLYVKGEFVGGCDITREMFQAGELQQLFADKGIQLKKSA